MNREGMTEDDAGRLDDQDAPQTDWQTAVNRAVWDALLEFRGILNGPQRSAICADIMTRLNGDVTALPPKVVSQDFCYAPGDEGSKYCGDPKGWHCEVLGNAAFWKSAKGQRHLVKCMKDDHLIHHSFVSTARSPVGEAPNELREMFPGRFVYLELTSGYSIGPRGKQDADISATIQVETASNGVLFAKTTPTLDEAMEKVREYHREQKNETPSIPKSR